MSQRSFFDSPAFPAPPSVPVATSEAAARAVRPDLLREQVFAFIRQCGQRGATDYEMQLELGMTGDTQRPRRWELVRAGLVRNSGAVRRTAGKRNAIVWIATEAK